MNGSSSTTSVFGSEDWLRASQGLTIISYFPGSDLSPNETRPLDLGATWGDDDDEGDAPPPR